MYSVRPASDTRYRGQSLKCIAISGSRTLGTEASQLECIVLSVSDTRYRGQSAGVYSVKLASDNRYRGQSAEV